ncbi:related to Splicing factor U2AF 23 kDa subunit [Zygosaccharomyces bailii ISA1307]|nr:related to Splicing factor U2AF 23 kDa subunit [Zygosaccharomyces bailii ISA1307]
MVNFPQEGMSYEEFDELYEDIYSEACKYGSVRSMVICENSNVHLKGNVYLYYEKEQDAQDAKDAFNTRWYDERPLYSDLTHISDFREAICRKHDMGTCERGGDCNFMHVKRPSTKLRIELEKAQAKKWQIKH